MALETATFISQLVTTNPVQTDSTGQGADHLRLIKSALHATFPNFTAAALNSTQAAIDAAVAAVTGTAAMVLIAGSAAVPGLTVAGSPSTGLYSDLADTLSVSVAGLRSATFNADKSVSFAGAAAFAGTGSFTGALSSSTSLDAPVVTQGGVSIVPTGVVLPFAGAAAPAGFVFCYGQQLSRTNFAALFSVVGTTYGAGDGSTTFNVPDGRDYVIGGKGDMGGVAANRLTGSTVLGSTQGAKDHVLTQAEMPSHTHTAQVTDPGHAHVYNGWEFGPNAASGGSVSLQPETTNSAFTGITVANANTGGGAAHPIVQPTLILNYIIKT